ncbi:DUF2911 domain-containing protein [Lacinutrix salivirga]
MNKFLKWLMLALFAVAISVFCYSYFNDGIFNKPLSPKKTVSFKVEDLEVEVFYNRPSKRERQVFGALVPYDRVWRTGANEATTFETNKDLVINNMRLEKGKYTVWTVPGEKSWKVMFNSKHYKWGVNEKMEPMWDPNFDVVEIEVETQAINTTVEQFTIAFDNSTDNLKLTMAWDNTKIEVPLQQASKLQALKK